MPKMIHANMNTSLAQCTRILCILLYDFFFLFWSCFFFYSSVVFIFQLDIYKTFFRLSWRWFGRCCMWQRERESRSKLAYAVLKSVIRCGFSKLATFPVQYSIFPFHSIRRFSVYFTKYSALSQLSKSNNRFCVRFNVANNYISQ